MKQHLNGKPLGYLMVLGAGALWGSLGCFVSILKGYGAESTLIAFIRLFLGLLLLIPILFYEGGLKAFKIDWNGLKLCLLTGLFSQALFNLLYNEAIKNVGVATASVLLYTSPIFVTMMSRIFFKENLNKAKCIALILSVTGCTLTVTGGNFHGMNFSAIGAAMGVGAGFFYALMTILGKTMTNHYDPLTSIFYSFAFGSLALAPLAQPWRHLELFLEPTFFMTAIGYGLLPTVFAYILYMKGISKGLEASKVSVITSVETVVAAMFGFLLFHESAGFFKLFGILLVFTSILAMNSESWMEQFRFHTAWKIIIRKVKKRRGI